MPFVQTQRLIKEGVAMGAGDCCLLARKWDRDFEVSVVPIEPGNEILSRDVKQSVFDPFRPEISLPAKGSYLFFSFLFKLLPVFCGFFWMGYSPTFHFRHCFLGLPTKGGARNCHREFWPDRQRNQAHACVSASTSVAPPSLPILSLTGTKLNGTAAGSLAGAPMALSSNWSSPLCRMSSLS